MKKRRTFKYWIGQIHLWLGLVSGLVVLIVSLTGCIFAFQKEISELLDRDMYFVQPATSRPLPLHLLQQNAQVALGAARAVETITTYNAKDRAWEFMTYKTNDTALTYFGAIEYYESVFINPYTGAVTGKKDYKYDFFAVVKYLHWSLLLNTPYGQPIVGYSTLLFAILLITGLVLWWPKKWTKAWKDRSFKIKWNASFKRVNYDLHNVPGFYSLLPALILACTGMVFAFPWFSGLVYAAAAGTTQQPAQVEVKSVKPVTAVTDHSGSSLAIYPIDLAFQTSQEQLPQAPRILLSRAEGPTGTIDAYVYKGTETYYGTDQFKFDQYSGKLLHRKNDSEKNRGQRLIEMNYDIHVGAIGGLTGKIIAFLISLICASLPVTGFLVWYGRKWGKKPLVKR